MNHLPAEIRRQGAKRAFILSGRTVSRSTPLVARVRALLGESFAGLYDEIGKDTPYANVAAARDQAREAGADLLVAVGAGSVIQGARIVAILLAETAPVEELITQYPPGKPAISPKLLAPKLPIVNILTACTSAQNRAGSPMKAAGREGRMEFFDPKTRPAAIFWDHDALLTAPVSMTCTSGAAIYWRAVMNMGYTRATPLADATRRQVFEMMRNALPRLRDPDDAAARTDLCIASFLQNREADDGAEPVRHWVSRVVYAFATGLFHLHGEVSQGAAHCAFTPAVMRRLGSRNPLEMSALASALGVWKDGDPVADAPHRAAAELERAFASIGLPASLSQLRIPKSSAAKILASALRNFNADPAQEFAKEEALLHEVLEAAW